MSEVAPTPPAAASTPPTTTGATTPPVSTDWTSSLAEDARGYVQTKGFKDPGAVLDSYRNLEKLVGVPPERVLKLPEKSDDPAWSGIYEKLGRPKDPKEYKLSTPEGQKLDPKYEEWAKSTFHELNLSTSQAEKLSAKMNEYSANKAQAMTADYTANIKEQEAALKKEWGAAFEQNINVAKRAAGVFGVDGAAIDAIESALGFDGTMKFFNQIGTRLGEDKFVTGGSAGGGAMTPEQARQQITALKNDPAFVNKVMNKDVESVEKWNKLHRFANPE